MRYFSNNIGILLLTILISIISPAISNDKILISKSETKISNGTKSSILLELLGNSKKLLEDAMYFAALNTSDPSLKIHRDKRLIDCSAILEANVEAKSGIYEIWPRNRIIERPFKVYCDMDDDGGGWTVIQRRGDFDSAKNYFYRKWEAYKIGFGDLLKDFWLGNNRIFTLTNQRANIVKFVLSDWEGNTTYATYDDFWIDNESQNYKLHVSGCRGTAGDSFSYHDGSQFSTNDRDNNGNCATKLSGAWWFKDCLRSHLNGLYLKGNDKVGYEQGLHWYHFRGDYYSMKDTVIKIRPRDYKKKFLDVTPH